MNERIRTQAKQRMKEQGFTQEALGEQLGIPRTHINQMLNGSIGKVPKRWEALADALGMEFALVAKTDK